MRWSNQQWKADLIFEWMRFRRNNTCNLSKLKGKHIWSVRISFHSTSPRVWKGFFCFLSPLLCATEASSIGEEFSWENNLFQLLQTQNIANNCRCIQILEDLIYNSEVMIFFTLIASFPSRYISVPFSASSVDVSFFILGKEWIDLCLLLHSFTYLAGCQNIYLDIQIQVLKPKPWQQRMEFRFFSRC